MNVELTGQPFRISICQAPATIKSTLPRFFLDVDVSRGSRCCLFLAAALQAADRPSPGARGQYQSARRLIAARGWLQQGKQKVGWVGWPLLRCSNGSAPAPGVAGGLLPSWLAWSIWEFNRTSRLFYPQVWPGWSRDETRAQAIDNGDSLSPFIGSDQHRGSRRASRPLSIVYIVPWCTVHTLQSRA